MFFPLQLSGQQIDNNRFGYTVSSAKQKPVIRTLKPIAKLASFQKPTPRILTTSFLQFAVDSTERKAEPLEDLNSFFGYYT